MIKKKNIPSHKYEMKQKLWQSKLRKSHDYDESKIYEIKPRITMTLKVKL